jgi:hypothetical protein
MGLFGWAFDVAFSAYKPKAQPNEYSFERAFS